MRLAMRLLLLAFALLGVSVSSAACGGRIDDPAPPSPPGSNGASNVAPTPGCAGACDRLHACASSFDDPRCVTSCERELPDPARARTYASCIQSLACDEIERDLHMDFGPIGACYAAASRLGP